jgi:hypothetical protein
MLPRWHDGKAYNGCGNGGNRLALYYGCFTHREGAAENLRVGLHLVLRGEIAAWTQIPVVSRSELSQFI